MSPCIPFPALPLLLARLSAFSHWPWPHCFYGPVRDSDGFAPFDLNTLFKITPADNPLFVYVWFNLSCGVLALCYVFSRLKERRTSRASE